MRPAGALALAVASALTNAESPASPPQEPPRFGATAELVLIDLIASKEGRFVSDLRPEEIEVYEEGKRQKIEFVRLVLPGTQAGSPTEPTSPPASSTAPPSAAPARTSGPTQSVSLVVIVDLATMSLDLLTRTRQAIVTLVREDVPPGTRLMLVALERGLQVRQAFTSDRARFVAAVESLPSPVGEGESSLSELVNNVDQTCDGSPFALETAISLARAWVENARLGMTHTVEGLAALARYLAPLPGRKQVVFYSAGYPMDPNAIAVAIVAGICQPPSASGSGTTGIESSLRAGAQVDSTGLLQGLVDEANHAQVSVYTVDARGLVGDAAPAGARVPTRLVRGGVAQDVVRRTVRAPQDFLFSMADGTGATASLNTNDLARGMRAALDDARAYYLVAYAPPPGRKEGRFYPIELKVGRPGLQLRYRRGYEWLSQAKRAERAVSAALRFPEIYADGGLVLEPQLEAGRLKVAVILPTAALVFRAEGGEHRNEITLHALLRDEKGKVVGGRVFTKTVSLKLPAARYADLRSRDNVEIPMETAAPPKGRCRITVVARHSDGRLAAGTRDVETP